MTVDVADDLKRAADYLDDHEWIRGRMSDDDGNCCVIGAVWCVVTGGQPIEVVDSQTLRILNADRALMTYLHENGLYEASSFGWNDNKCASKAEAQKTLRQAAAWWRKEGAATQ